MKAYSAGKKTSGMRMRVVQIRLKETTVGHLALLAKTAKISETDLLTVLITNEYNLSVQAMQERLMAGRKPFPQNPPAPPAPEAIE